MTVPGVPNDHTKYLLVRILHPQSTVSSACVPSLGFAARQINTPLSTYAIERRPNQSFLYFYFLRAKTYTWKLDFYIYINCNTTIYILPISLSMNFVENIVSYLRGGQETWVPFIFFLGSAIYRHFEQDLSDSRQNGREGNLARRLVRLQ